MTKELYAGVETIRLVSRFRDEYRGCVDSLETNIIDHFLTDESRTIEEREQICSALCEIFAIMSGAFNLNTIVKASGIREQMEQHFGV